MFSRLWNLVSVGATGYMIYQHWQQQAAVKSIIYNELTPDLQAKWDSIFGKPDVAAPTSPTMPQVKV